MGTWAQGTSSHGNGQGWVGTGGLAAFIGGNGGSLEKGRILQSSEASLGHRVGRPISGLSPIVHVRPLVRHLLHLVSSAANY